QQNGREGHEEDPNASHVDGLGGEDANDCISSRSARSRNEWRTTARGCGTHKSYESLGHLVIIVMYPRRPPSGFPAPTRCRISVCVAGGSAVSRNESCSARRVPPVPVSGALEGGHRVMRVSVGSWSARGLGLVLALFVLQSLASTQAWAQG